MLKIGKARELIECGNDDIIGDTIVFSGMVWCFDVSNLWGSDGLSCWVGDKPSALGLRCFLKLTVKEIDKAHNTSAIVELANARVV